MPVISSLILTNQLPTNTYTSLVTTSGSVIADGLGNQLTSLQLTSSYSATASVALNASPGSSLSSSWASSSLSASYISPYVTYSLDLTSSTNWITASFANTNQQVNLTVSALYNFTHSNSPVLGQICDLMLFISHSVSSATSSLSFPSTWTNLGNGWPTSISSSKVAMIWLRGIDTNKVIGTYCSN